MYRVNKYFRWVALAITGLSIGGCGTAPAQWIIDLNGKWRIEGTPSGQTTPYAVCFTIKDGAIVAAWDGCRTEGTVQDDGLITRDEFGRYTFGFTFKAADPNTGAGGTISVSMTGVSSGSHFIGNATFNVTAENGQTTGDVSMPAMMGRG